MIVILSVQMKNIYQKLKIKRPLKYGLLLLMHTYFLY
jgi:RNA polymerase subunit RPABC4/transcription elongation factor Spt4